MNQPFQTKTLNLKLQGGDAQFACHALKELARRIRESGEEDVYNQAGELEHVAKVLEGQVAKAAAEHDRQLKA